MADALEGPLPHPGSVVFDILGQALGVPVVIALFRTRMRRFAVLEQRGNLDHRLANHDGHGVQIAAVGGKSQTLCLKWNGAATREGVVDGRQFTITIPDNLGTGACEHLLVGRVFPFHEIFYYGEEPSAFSLHGLLRGESIGMSRGVVHQLREQYRTAGCQRPPGPP